MDNFSLPDSELSNFLIQDPFGLREVIQPIVSISEKSGAIRGLGTCFQISPWRWATAHHVVYHSHDLAFPPEEVGAVGFSPGLIYGRVNFMLEDHFGEIVERLVFKNVGVENLEILGQNGRSKIVIDVATLRVNVQNLKRKHLVSPLRISNARMNVGDEVLAIGYPIMGTNFRAEDAEGVFQEEMNGARGVVRQLHPNGLGAGRAWPTIEIEADWPGGLSGGPVINKNGQVVGIVSSSLAPDENLPGCGFAVDLTKLPVERLAPELDRVNPGWSKGYGVFNGEKLVAFLPDAASAEMFQQKWGGTKIIAISLNPQTEDWVALDQ